MADNQPTIQESIDALTHKAADDVMASVEQFEATNKMGGEIADESAALEQTEPANQAESETQEAPASPPSEKVFGKYDNLEEAGKGYWNAANSLTAAHQKNQELTNQILEMQAQQLQQPQRVNPAERAAERDYNKELSDLGVDPEIVHGLVQNGVVQETQKLFGPVLNQMQAEQNLMDNDPGYNGEVSGRLNKFISGNAAVKARVDAANAAGQADLGREWALGQMRATEGDVVEKAQTANNEVRNEIVEEQVKQAAPVKKTSSQGREIDSAPKDDKYIDRAEFDRLNALAKRGYTAPLLRKTIGAGLPDEFFN